ncbi:MAG: TIGR00282 family metallophosphoesterase [Chloroflexota bacterium]|nr:MAG: TIGR00282 family metallophosphoesterase [Chloroflexota bacterium]
MRILFIGDIVGKPGRKAVRRLLPRLRETYQPDVVLANGENMAGGAGITRDTAREMFDLGIALLTTGNHVWDQREALEYLAEDVPIVRPINYPPGAPGLGVREVAVGAVNLVVVNVQGRVFMRPLDDPFRAMDTALTELKGKSHVLVDLHAEATGEKQALGFYLDGRVSAIVGTHTHVPTADARVLPKGTAYITDVGMVGPRESVIGVEPAAVIQRHLTQMYHRFEVGSGPVLFCAVLIDLNDETGRALGIHPIQEIVAN